MLKKILTVFTLLYAAATFAAVDANQASAAELDSIKGIGPGLSGKIMDERKKAPFKDWNDLITRVNGVGATSAAKYSNQGLTVNGSAFNAALPTQHPPWRVFLCSRADGWCAVCSYFHSKAALLASRMRRTCP